MSRFSAALGSFLSAGRWAGNGRKRDAKCPMNRPLHIRDLRVESLEDRTLLSAGGSGDLGTSYLPPRSDLFQLGGYLTEPSSGTPIKIAMAYLTSHAYQFGLSSGDMLHSVVTDQYASPDTGMTHIYLRQELNGLQVVNANMNVNVTADGRVLNVGGGFVPGLSRLENTSAEAARPALTASKVLQHAACDLGLALDSAPITAAAATDDLFQNTMLADSKLSLDPIPAKLQYVATGDGVQLAWNYVLRTPDGQHWYDVYADSTTEKVLFANDWVNEASYTVFALPTESPNDGTRTVVVDPASKTASPYGWQDTNGVVGAEYTDTRGNNVSAQDDWDNNNTGGTRPNGGAGLSFDFPLDLTQDPHVYVSAAVTNLFYWNNLSHDIHYGYGFNEVAGNFQQTNYTGLGLGNDAVQADAQDGGGMNNANFATPPDGSAPRMQMYEFDMTTPHRDGDLDNMIVVHEYGHGVSNRLVGGPSNVNALKALQSGGMGEGWSDWWGLMFMQKTTDTKLANYPIGTYVLGQSPTGGGIRRYPYSFNMTVDPLTYGVYNSSNEVHNSGEIWCSALWDVNWLLIDKYGFNANLAAGYTGPGSAGNILALQLVTDSLKIMPANPTFLNSRDAMLLADQALTGGANQAVIWTAFARRGMGFSAYDGGNANATKVVEAFDLPTPDPMVMSSSPSGSVALPVNSLVFTFNEAINPASFTVAEDVASFTGPGAVNLKPAITGFSWTNANKTLQIAFAAQTTPGSYSLTIGPQILAADNGHPMNQDMDANLGEVPDDQYTATFQGAVAIYSATMDVNPGWTISGGQWAFGHPTGQGGTTHGFPDPSNGYTGSNVIGVNLTGDYSTTLGGPYYVTTQAINCSGNTGVKLDFMRWLNTDYLPYVYATIDVSNNGSTWSNVYTNPTGGQVADSAWQHMTYDISAVANNQSTVYVRWGYQIGSAGAWAYSGWNIDDVVVTGMPTGPDTAGPKVTGQTPTGTVAPGQTFTQFSFNEPMDTASFAVATDVVSFTGPGTVDLKPQITGFTWVNSQKLNVQFKSQTTVGAYTMVIGPNITDDAPSFNPMNQDGDAVNGEVPDDRYSGSFIISNASPGIEGDKWNDLDGDGIRDAGEPTLANWTIYLDTDNDGTLDAGEPTQITDALGHYVFTGLLPATYTVREVLQPGWRQTSPGGTATTNLIVNGGFETDNFSGWTLENSGSGTFVINNGTFDPSSPDGPLTPYDGAYSALSEMTGSGIHTIFQDIAIPAGGPVTLNWVDRIRNHANVFQDPVQEYRVEIRNTTNIVLATIFSTNPGDPLMSEWTARNADLSAYAGQTVRVAFVEQDSLLWLNVHVDDVSMVVGIGGNGAHTVVLAAGQIVTGKDFGNQEQLLGRIEGDQWNDLDGDGVRDAGEPTLANWTIYLDTNNNGTLDTGEPTQVTDALGHYVFTGLLPATYTVREVLQPGWTQTFPGGTATTNLIVNGGFETGNFSGWTVNTPINPYAPWAVSPAGAGTKGTKSPTSPHEGTYDAWNGFDGGGPIEFTMYQDVTISAGSVATLTWMDRAQWTVSGQPRTLQVQVRNPVTNAILGTVYSFSTTGTSGDTGWQSHSDNLSSYAGSKVRLYFIENIPENFTGPGQIEFDAISLMAGSSAGAHTVVLAAGQIVTGKDFGSYQKLDYGDAPAPYPTLLADNGARHIIGGPHLGSAVDAEPDGQPTANADGDDTNGVPNDEDGVVFNTLIQNGTTASVDVTAFGTSKLNAWIDFNRDGDWSDVGEQIFTDRVLANGLNSLTFAVPGGSATKAGVSYARFRVNTAGGLSYTGQADGGEVEDYKVQLYSSVAGRRIFYNNSAWDGNSVEANALDDNAIATDKSALLAGGTRSFANYTSYLKGINGIMVDIAGLAGTPTAADFLFKMGNTSAPSSWAAAPAPTSITVRAGVGVGGSDRVTIVWAPNTIQNKWLQVIVLAANTGLPTLGDPNIGDTHYWGNQIGETGNNPANTKVDSNDAGAFVANYSKLNKVPITSPYDINRDKYVNSSDSGAIMPNYTGIKPTLIFLNAPAIQPSALGSEALLMSSMYALVGASAARSATPASAAAVDAVHAQAIAVSEPRAANRLEAEVPTLAILLAKTFRSTTCARTIAISDYGIGLKSPLGTTLEEYLLLGMLAQVRR